MKIPFINLEKITVGVNNVHKILGLVGLGLGLVVLGLGLGLVLVLGLV